MQKLTHTNDQREQTGSSIYINFISTSVTEPFFYCYEPANQTNEPTVKLGVIKREAQIKQTEKFSARFNQIR
jgi:hypothetical protein